MSKKVLIVGGVAGGASTAARLRRLDDTIEIIMFERSPYISFANCGLPYYIGGTIKDRDALLLQTPEAMMARFNMDIRVEHEVVDIDPVKKTVTVHDIRQSVKYEESYDELVLSPGSTPIKPPIPGIDASNIFSLWNIPDTDRIKNYVTTHEVKRAVVVGGGFIGIEMVENLHDLGVDVSLVEMSGQVMAPLDFEMAQLVHSHITAQGVDLHLNNGVQRFDYSHGVTTVTLQDGKLLTADMVILSIGISPNSELGKLAGIDLNDRGGIVVNQRMRTSDPSIYALGDVVEIDDYMTGGRAMIPLAGPANKQGRIVANNIAGRQDSLYEGTQGTSVAKIFDLTVASTGLNEKALNRSGKVYGKDYLMTVIQPKSHAGYYPGAYPMTLKVLFDKEGKVLGAQNVGIEGVEKRIDVIATALRFGGTIHDLQRLELAYAPPYSSAKDPVNMAGFAAENILKDDQPVILWRDVAFLDPDTTLLVDVREKAETDLGIIGDALHIPVNDIRHRMAELPKDKTIILYCAVGVRGYIAARILKQAGYDVKNLIGGYNVYKYFIKDYNAASASNEEVVKQAIEPTKEKDWYSPVVSADLDEAIHLDACGLQCPGPIMKLSKKMPELNEGDLLKISSTDPGFVVDAEAWAHKTGNTFIKKDKEDGAYVAYIRRGGKPVTTASTNLLNASTQVVFSGDLDKALAAMIIANGAAAMGRKVTLFFTFWGLNILRKSERVPVKKSPIEAMFGAMMPRGSKKLKLSHMNMGGMGTAMMHGVMANKNVETLDALIQSAMANGVKFVACTMSMDIMGIKEEELIDGVSLGGVAAYLGEADASNHNLFI